jgi:carboxymethylenebutenolidase
MSEISISTPNHQLKGYLATPQGKGPWPGVVVLHDIFGMTDVTRGHADWLAKEGFLAVAPDLFSWGGRIRCIRSLMADLAAQKGPSFDDVDAIRQWLVDRRDCTGKTGVIGFCASGGFAILLAVGHGFSAVAPNYGHIPDDIDAFLNGACPMVASFGASDWMVPKGTAARLEDALKQRKIEHDIKQYPGVGHAFLDDYKGPMRVLCVVLRASYKDKEAADARKRIRAFFARHLT